ncbi:MAG: hypothetical protein JWM68_220 [Verrucomicrobiales bacterium]|nr:hypothetical protein [Verrucomicrobiales bacterium]
MGALTSTFYEQACRRCEKPNSPKLLIFSYVKLYLFLNTVLQLRKDAL